MFQLSILTTLLLLTVLVIVLVFTATGMQKQNYFLLYLPLLLFLIKKNTFEQGLYTILGIIYLGVPACVLYLTAQQSPFYLRTLFVITIVWISDISAYLVGRYFGRHLLIPRISPKKTWEGLLGSFLCCAVGIFVWFQAGLVTEQKYIWIGILTALATPIGDLIESAIKRNANIKDTSQLLPGHGGFLDRFDGFFFAIIAQYWI